MRGLNLAFYMSEYVILLTLILRGIKGKFVYHQLRLNKKFLIKDSIGLLNLYGNYGAKVINIDLLFNGRKVTNL